MIDCELRNVAINCGQLVLTDCDIRFTTIRQGKITLRGPKIRTDHVLYSNGNRKASVAVDQTIEVMPGFRELLIDKVKSNDFVMKAWHSTCGTKHCLAGWVIKLHPQGKDLEKRYNTAWAAAMILSTHKLAIPNFYLLSGVNGWLENPDLES